MKLDSKSGIVRFYEDLGKKLDIERYRLETCWKVQSLLTVIPSHKFGSVLELGCGGGVVLKGVSEAVNADKMIGVDIATSMLSIAQRECPDALFIEGDAENLPFDDHSIDLVILCDILEHVYHPDMLIREAQRVARYIAIKVPLERCVGVKLLEIVSRKKTHGPQHVEGHLYAWGKKDVFKLLTSAGLNLLSSKLVDPPENIRNYNPGERFKFLPCGKRLAILLERITFKFSRPIYRFLFGSTMVAFAESGRNLEGKAE